MLSFSASYPTAIHSAAVQAISDFFRGDDRVSAVLVTNSCARGQATPASDLDMVVLVPPAVLAVEQANLESAWLTFRAEQPALVALRQLGPFTHIHLDFSDGQFVPETWDDGGGPDGFELGVGNLVAYGALLWERSAAFQVLQDRWLPYYADSLRHERLAMVTEACRYDLSFIPFYVSRGLYFQAFDRLYRALQEFLQGLFIARRTYALAYNKWIRMQVVDWLGLPEVYAELPQILQISHLESDQVVERAARLNRLTDAWLVS